MFHFNPQCYFPGTKSCVQQFGFSDILKDDSTKDPQKPTKYVYCVSLCGLKLSCRARVVDESIPFCCVRVWGDTVGLGFIGKFQCTFSKICALFRACFKSDRAKLPNCLTGNPVASFSFRQLAIWQHAQQAASKEPLCATMEQRELSTFIQTSMPQSQKGVL